MSFTKEHNTWMGMRERCEKKTDKRYQDYGGRGIKVCERWQTFSNFLADMGRAPSEKHSLDRFPDKNGNYEPGNCRWATNTEQCRNKRDNHYITVKGDTKCLVEWSEISGIKAPTIRARLKTGWSPENAVFKALR